MILRSNVSYRVKINFRFYDLLTGVYNIKIPADISHLVRLTCFAKIFLRFMGKDVRLDRVGKLPDAMD